MLDLIKEFENELEKAYYKNTVIEQIYEFSKISHKIILFCKTTVKPLNPNDLLLNTIILNISNAESENLVSKHHKDVNKRKQMHIDRMNSFKEEISIELRLLKNHIADGQIVKSEE